MSTLAARAEDLKLILRGLLVSSPRVITVDQLERDFRLQEGRNVPFRELGYPTFMKYLESIPDTVVVCPSLNGGCPIAKLVQSERSAHVDLLVQKQKCPPPKRLSRTRHLGPYRSAVKAIPQMSSTYHSTNYNSSYTQQRMFIPASLQRRICTMIRDKPKGVPVQTIEREFLSSQTLQNYGLHEGCDIHQLLSCLRHFLKISNGMVYPLQDKTPPYRPIVENPDGMVYPLQEKTPPYRPIVENPVTDNQTSNIRNSQTYRFIPAGCEGEIDEESNQNDNVNVGNEFSGEINKEDDADIAEALHKQTKVTEIIEGTLVSPTRSVTLDTEEDLKVSPDSGSPSDDTRTYTCDITSDVVGKKMKMNFQTLLDKHPNGIWCSELPDLYKKEFAVVLEYADLGFMSMIHMASHLPDVFHCIRPDGTDWKLFDARKKLPPEHAANDIKSNKHDLKVSPDSGSPSDDTRTYTCDITSDVVGKKMKMNFQTLLDKHPNGIWCSELPDLYKKEFAVVLEYADLGFMSMIHMASHLPDVFHCIRPDGTDWKLFDARKKLPPEHAANDIKSNKHVLTKMVPTIPSKVRLNLKKLLTDYPNGMPSELIPHLYTEEFRTTLNVQEMGFDSVEAFLLVLNESVLHLRYVNKKILVYPLAHETEPKKENPLPHITEPQDNFLNLYPPEVVGPKGTLTHEKIPPEATPGGCIEVLVAEIYTPLNFWIQLRGETTHIALDRLMNDMQLFYEQQADNYNMPVATVRIGQYCVAPYSEEWHRACITAVHNLVDVQVLFVDYGTTCRMKKCELRFMHMDYALLPIQAIKASLVNLSPVGDEKKWPHETSVRFLELVMDKNLVAIVSSVDRELVRNHTFKTYCHFQKYEAINDRLCYQKALVAAVCEMDLQARKMEVALVDTTGKEDVHINDVLVKEGLAEYKTNRPSSPLPPQPKRIDGDPVSSTITVSRPPPGFTAVSELHNQPLLSPIGSTAPSQSTYVPEMPGKSHLQTSVPTLPMANTIPSNFIPQPTDVPVLPVMYDVPLVANASSLAAQSSMLQQLALYENFLQQQQFMRSFALLLSQNIGAASLVNPFMMPVLNPPMMYTQTPVSERITNVGRSELGISEVPSTPSPQKNTSEQISPSGAGQLAAAANVSTEDSASAPATSGTHTETKKLPSVISSGVSHLSVIVNSSPEPCTADVQCNEQPTAEAIASSKEVKAMSQVTHEQEQNKDELVHKVLSNTALTEFSSGSYQSDDTVDSHGLESESDIGFESLYVNEGTEPGTDLSTSSDEIYRSDDEDDDEGGEGVCEQQKQPTLRESQYVKQIEIAGRVLHLIKVMNTLFFCTEEVVRHFTDFSGRHVVLKILDARGVKIPFCELGRMDSHAIIDDLEAYNVVGVPKSPNGYVIGKVHLTPLTSITDFIPLLNVEYQEEFCSVVESVIW